MTRKKLCTYEDYDLYLLGKTNTHLNLEFVDADADGDRTIQFSIELTPSELDMDGRYSCISTKLCKNILPFKPDQNDMYLVDMGYATCYPNGKMAMDTFSLSEHDYADDNAFCDTDNYVLTYKYPSVRRILRSPKLIDMAISYARDLGEVEDFVDMADKSHNIPLSVLYEGLFFYYEKEKILFTEKK